MKVSSKPDDIIVTYSLGSCVGITIYDPELRVGGMAHCMLPISRLDPQKAKENPIMFTDTGVPALIQAVMDMGGSRRRLVAKVAGGASPLNDNGMFKIGERNYTVVRKVLWKNDILIASEEVGGTAARTLYLFLDTGRTVIRSGGVEREL
jgi:chemotaxis protein CheD